MILLLLLLFVSFCLGSLFFQFHFILETFLFTHSYHPYNLMYLLTDSMAIDYAKIFISFLSLVSQHSSQSLTLAVLTWSLCITVNLYWLRFFDLQNILGLIYFKLRHCIKFMMPVQYTYVSTALWGCTLSASRLAFNRTSLTTFPWYVSQYSISYILYRFTGWTWQANIESRVENIGVSVNSATFPVMHLCTEYVQV